MGKQDEVDSEDLERGQERLFRIPMLYLKHAEQVSLKLWKH
jgi:hypothetical protein